MGICLKESMNLSVDIGAVIVIQLIFAAMQRGEPMDDLISRQAAIDGKICIQRSNGVEIYDDYAVPVEYLEQLPPAQLGTNLASLGTDCISRQKAISALYEWECDNKDDRDAIDVINGLPPIQPKRGKWIEDKGQQTLMQNFIERGEVWRVCSVCGAGHMIGHKYASDKAYHDRHHNFCPNCGADMRGEQDG